MKLVVAVIHPTKLKAVREALEKTEVLRMTVLDAQGFGKPSQWLWRTGPNEPRTKLLRKVVLEVLVNDDFLQRTIDTISNVARTGPEGSIGDGWIFVLPTEEAIQLSDVGRGPGAV